MRINITNNYSMYISEFINEYCSKVKNKENEFNWNTK